MPRETTLKNLLPISITALVLLLVFFIGRYSKIDGNDKVKNGYERYYLYNNYFDVLSNEDKDAMKLQLTSTDINLEDIVNNKFFIANGINVNNIEFASYDKIVAIKDIKGPICIEIIADWCKYCQQESTERIDEIIEQHPECTFIQYMDTGSKEQVDKFYEEIGKEPHENLIIVYNISDFDELIDEYEYSYPSMMYINNEHRVSGFTSGLLDANKFNTAYNISNNIETYKLKTINGDYFYELPNKDAYARGYLSELEYIDIPKAYKPIQ